MSQSVRFDLYDHDLSFWFRNFTLANWTYPQIDQAAEAVTPVCGISPALAFADKMEASL